MARIHPSKGYFEVATTEQQMAELKRRWSGKHEVYNTEHSTCSTCEGRGYTKATRTTIKRVKGKLRTTELGSGCPVCFGSGKVAK